MAAIAVPSANSLLGWFTATAFGADHTGANDSTAAIQAAINAAQSAGGGNVYLPAGTYLQSSAITVTEPNVNIVGAGAWATTIVTATTGNAWTISGGQGMLSGFSIGPKITRSPGIYEFALRGASFYRIEDIEIRPQGIGVAWGSFDISGASSTSVVYIRGVTSWGPVRFVNLDNCNDIFFDQCVGWTNAANGSAVPMIAAEGSNIVQAIGMSDCDFVGNASANSSVLHSSNSSFRFNKFTGVYFDTASPGVLIDAGAQLDFTACWFSNRPGDGMVINGGDTVHVIGGQCFNGGGRGIYLNGGSGHLVQGLSIAAVGQTSASPAIEISSSCSGARILGNEARPTDSGFSGNISVGCLIGSGATNVLVDQNDFHLCTASVTNNASGTSSVKVGTNL